MPTMMFEKRTLTMEDAVADFKDYVDVAVEERTEELARMVAKGFAGVDKDFVEVHAKFREMGGRLDGIDGRLEGMDKRFDGMDVRFDRLENLIIERTK